MQQLLRKRWLRFHQNVKRSRLFQNPAAFPGQVARKIAAHSRYHQ
jgi:hypothetical protein